MGARRSHLSLGFGLLIISSQFLFLPLSGREVVSADKLMRRA